MLAKALKQAYPGIVIGPGDLGDECVISDELIVYWGRPEQKPIESNVISVYDPLPDVRALKLAEIRSEAASIIEAKWPLWKQNNCAMGVYPEAVAATCTDDIAAVIASSNAAEDAVDAATTVAEVEAVTPVWPVL